MDAQCPNCGTIYEVMENEIGTKAVCDACREEFVIVEKPNVNPRKSIVIQPVKGRKQMVIPSTKGGKRNSIARPAMTDRGDVMFISPAIARILQYILYFVSVVIAFVQLGAGVMWISNGDAKSLEAGCILIASSLVGLLIALLLVRLFYEGVVALFEIVRHLREIRDKLYD